MTKNLKQQAAERHRVKRARAKMVKAKERRGSNRGRGQKVVGVLK